MMMVISVSCLSHKYEPVRDMETSFLLRHDLVVPSVGLVCLLAHYESQRRADLVIGRLHWKLPTFCLILQQSLFAQ